MKKSQALITLFLAFVVLFAGLTGTITFAASPEPHGVITISFDDNTKNQYDYAYPLMKARGILGTFYTVTDQISDFSNDNNFMSIADLQTLQADGNEIGSHSKTHSHFTQLSDSEINEECSISRAVLQSYGFPAENFAYPYGDRDERTDAIVDDYYRSGRTSWGGSWTMPLPVSEFLVTGNAGETGEPDVLSYLQQIVDSVYDMNQWGIIYFHNIVPDAYNEEYTISSQDFESFLDYIVSLGIPTVTVDQGLDLSAPPSSLPTVTIDPTSVRIDIGQSVTFTSTVVGGYYPYSYQWYLNDNAVSGATGESWVLTPTVGGNYKVYLKVTDSIGSGASSNIVTDILVNSHGVVSIAFDDNYQDQYTYAFPLMQTRGIAGTFYAVTNQISDFSGDSSYMSTAELQALQDSGNEIGSHSVTHRDFTELSDAEIHTECSSSKQTLASYGLSVSNFAYPGGLTNDHIDSIVSEYYRSGRTAYVGPYLMELPTQFRLAGFSAEDSPNELQSLKDIVDEAYATDTWVIILFHHVIPGDYSSLLTTSAEDFASFLDYTINKGVEILTVNETLDKSTPVSNVLFSDGFESGNLDAWTMNIVADGCSFTTSSSRAHTGTYSGAASIDGDSPYDHALVQKLLSPFSSISTLASFSLSALPPPGRATMLIGYTDHYDDHESVFLKNSGGTYYLGVVRYVSGSTNREVVLSPVSLAANTWFDVKFILVSSGTSGLERIYFNGIEQTGLTRINADNDRGGVIDTCVDVGVNGWDLNVLGQGGADWAFTMYVDDVLVTTYVNSSPTYRNLGYSSSVAGSNVVFSSLWNDDSGLSKYIFSTNNTGVWMNDTATAFSSTPGWANTTKTLNINVGSVVGYRWFVNDSDNAWSSTSIRTLTVTSPLSVTVTPTQAVMYFGQSQTFTSLLTGGTSPYSYQWYLNDTAVAGATSSTWTFTPNANGYYKVYLNVTDAQNTEVQSNLVTNLTVVSVYILVTPQPNQNHYQLGQAVSFAVSVFNQDNPALNSSLTLTITGPGGQSHFEVQPISMDANTVREYKFDWIVPAVAGTYVVEVGLAPAQLTAYDAVWLMVS